MSGQISESGVSKEVDKTLKDTCLEKEKRYEIHFPERGS